LAEFWANMVGNTDDVIAGFWPEGFPRCRLQLKKALYLQFLTE
jgi:hypothetical protein